MKKLLPPLLPPILPLLISLNADAQSICLTTVFCQITKSVTLKCENVDCKCQLKTTRLPFHAEEVNLKK